MIKSVARIAALSAAFWPVLMSTPAIAGVPEEMKALIEQRRAGEAYELGLLHPEMLGEPLFDYYFGIAAVDAGRATIGVLALERFVMVDPSNDLARLELGRAYFEIGDYARAKREFDAVQAKAPPLGVQLTIQRFLDAMKSRTRSRTIAISGFLEAGLGITTNANGGIGSPDITIPVFGAVKLDERALAQNSEFQQASGALAVTAPLGGNLKAILTMSAAMMHYSRASGYDIDVGGATLEIGHVSDKLILTAGPTGSMTLLAGERYRNTYGVKGAAQIQLAPRTVAKSEITYQTLNYFGLNRNRTGRLLAISLGLDQELILPLRPILSLSGYRASDDNRSGRADFTRKITGGRLGGAVFPSDSFAISFGYSLARWNYQAPDLLFGFNRKDWFRLADASAQFKLQDGLTLRLEGQMANDDANIPLYKYKQRQLSLVLRREFR